MDRLVLLERRDLLDKPEPLDYLDCRVLLDHLEKEEMKVVLACEEWLVLQELRVREVHLDLKARKEQSVEMVSLAQSVSRERLE